MSKIHQKIMEIQFPRIMKRLIILAVLAALLGGGLSAFMLRTQISEAVSEARSWEQQAERSYPARESWSGARDFEDGQQAYAQGIHHYEEYDRQERDFLEGAHITKPGLPAKITVSAAAIVLTLLAAAYWLLVAAWLYQAAVRSKMNGLLWFLAGLCGNILAALLFLLLRSSRRQKCPACGRWQLGKRWFCADCGAEMSKNCPGCGMLCSAGDTYCSRCGRPLHDAHYEENAEQ